MESGDIKSCNGTSAVIKSGDVASVVIELDDVASTAIESGYINSGNVTWCQWFTQPGNRLITNIDEGLMKVKNKMMLWQVVCPLSS